MIGALRDRVSILKRSTATDTQGGRAVTWVDYITGTATLTRLPASVMPTKTGTETLQAAQVGATLDYTVTVRYLADVDETMQVSWTPYKATTAKTLSIQGAHALDGGRVYTVLECSEV